MEVLADFSDPAILIHNKNDDDIEVNMLEGYQILS